MSATSAMWWPSIVTGLIAGAVSLIGIYFNNRFVSKRDQSAAIAREKKQKEKRDTACHFISSEIVLLLEDFAEKCAAVSQDYGEPCGGQGQYETVTMLPELTLDKTDGDWQSLPPGLMFAVREMPARATQARKQLNGEQFDDPPEYKLYFQTRQGLYAELGLRAVFLAHRLRRLNGMPSSRLNRREWSVQSQLWEAWKRYIGMRHVLRIDKIRQRNP